MRGNRFYYIFSRTVTPSACIMTLYYLPLQKFKVLNQFRWSVCLSHTLSEAIGSLGCRRNSSSGSVLISQLTELQLMTWSRSVESAGKIWPKNNRSFEKIMCSNWILTESRLRWLYTVWWAISSESVRPRAHFAPPIFHWCIHRNGMVLTTVLLLIKR